MNIIFDVDETLYSMTQPFERAFQEIWQGKYKVDVHKLYAVSRVYSDKIFDKVMAGEVSIDGAGIYRMQNAMRDFGYDITKEEAMEFQKVYRKHQRNIDMSETMEDILNYLSGQKVFLGILTNGETEHQQEKIRGMKIERWISQDSIFVSDAVGYSKPDARAFYAVEKALCLDKKETWYVGDSIENDLEGALGAGWHMILLNRRNNDTENLKVKPDYIVENEDRLLELLKKIVPENP